VAAHALADAINTVQVVIFFLLKSKARHGEIKNGLGFRKIY